MLRPFLENVTELNSATANISWYGEPAEASNSCNSSAFVNAFPCSRSCVTGSRTARGLRSSTLCALTVALYTFGGAYAVNMVTTTKRDTAATVIIFQYRARIMTSLNRSLSRLWTRSCPSASNLFNSSWHCIGIIFRSSILPKCGLMWFLYLLKSCWKVLAAKLSRRTTKTTRTATGQPPRRFQIRTLKAFWNSLHRRF